MPQQRVYEIARQRVYEIARARELPAGTVIELLRDAGLDVSHHSNSVDADDARAALDGHGAAGNGAPASSSGAGSAVDANGTGAPESVGVIDRLLLKLLHKRRLARLEKEQEAELVDVGGLAVELRRVGSERDDPTARVEAAVRRDAELLRLQKLIEPGRVGGTCASCGLHSARTRYCLRCGHTLPGTRSITDRMSLPLAGMAVVLITLAWLLGGLGGGTSPEQRGDNSASQARPSANAPAAGRAAAPVESAAAPADSIVASARAASVGVYRRPGGGGEPYLTLDSPNLDGARLVFLVKRLQGTWAQVYLPSRPNGSTGWVRLARVSLSRHPYRVFIDLGRRRLTAWNGSRKLVSTPIGVGKSLTPTPAGLYYITSLLKQPDPTGTYGPYALGLSAHSDVLFEFAGRDGILGIHGTNEPTGIGKDVSHGCIRVSNDVITKLAGILPAGTPVRIRRSDQPRPGPQQGSRPVSVR